MSEARKILVTSALPYANGSIHLGHMLEYIQTDMWVRFQKMRGNQWIYVCADDAHGSAIMLRAEKEGISPEQLIDNVHAEHSADFAEFLRGFDNFYTTHSEENRELSEQIYQRLQAAGHIATRSVTQYFDPEKGMFSLPTVSSKAPAQKCATPDQYGDNCEKCGATYHPTELETSALSHFRCHAGTKILSTTFLSYPISKTCSKSGRAAATLKSPSPTSSPNGSIAVCKSGDISRDAPYFGFEIPDAPE